MATTMLKIDWSEVEKYMLAGGTFPQASIAFGVKEDTIRKRAKRYAWPLPGVIAKRAKNMKAVAAKNTAIIEQQAESWATRGDKHRDVVFKIAHESIAKMKPRAPKNFREAEAADRMARRAAGLETAEVVSQTLIQVNERVNEHDVIEAEVVEPTS